MHLYVSQTPKTAKTSAAAASAAGRRAAKPAPWRPQPSGLTRDELRAIVLEQLG